MNKIINNIEIINRKVFPFCFPRYHLKINMQNNIIPNVPKEINKARKMVCLSR